MEADTELEFVDGKERTRRREEEAGTARGEEERAASLSSFADHVAKQRREAHASLTSITPRFQRGHRATKRVSEVRSLRLAKL